MFWTKIASKTLDMLKFISIYVFKGLDVSLPSFLEFLSYMHNSMRTKNIYMKSNNNRLKDWKLPSVCKQNKYKKVKCWA